MKEDSIATSFEGVSKVLKESLIKYTESILSTFDQEIAKVYLAAYRRNNKAQ